MANEPSTIAYDPEDRLHEAIASFEQARDDGRNPDPAAWLDDYPDVAVRLAGYFADQGGLKRLAAPLLPAAPVCSLPRPFGAYELLEEIGRGGMGVVYRACQVPLKRTVALKMILAGQLASSDEVRRFRTEAENAATLDHPNIVPIHEVGEQDGQHYFSMKLIEGTNLGQQLKHFTADPRAAARLMALVARAIHHAHQRGILHRDLKPGNILLDAQGQPHITDFGLAKRIAGDAGLTLSGAVVGTPPYMAPEQAAGQNRELTTAADVYALGAILYELLTGEPPFQAATPLETLVRVRNDEPVPPHRVRPGVDRDLETVCLKCLEKDPARRYGSAEALAEDLERWLRGEAISARRASTWERAVKWVRRHPAPAALVLVSALAALALVGVVVGWVYGAQLAEANDELASAKTSTELLNGQLAQALTKTKKQEAETAAQRAEAERQRARAERYLYVARFNLAERLSRDGKDELARESLRSLRPRGQGAEDLCGLEWHYLWQRVCGECRALRGHTGEVGCLAFSPDGRLLATAGADWVVKVWDPVTGRSLCAIQTFPGVRALAFSGDGNHLAVATRETGFTLWESVSGRAVGRFRCDLPAAALPLFARQARWLVRSGPGGTVAVRNERTGWEAHPDQAAAPRAGNSLPSIPGGVLPLLAAKAAGFLGCTHGEGSLPALGGLAHSASWCSLLSPRPGVAFSLDGRIYVEIERKKKPPPDRKWVMLLHIRDLLSGATLASYAGHEHSYAHHEQPVVTMAFSDDGRLIASGGKGGRVHVWNPVNGQAILTLAQGSAVRALTFSPDGRWLASGGADGVIQIWNLGNREPLLLKISADTFEGSSPTGCTAVAFSPEGSRLVGFGETATVVWDARTGKELSKLPGTDRYGRGAYHPKGRSFSDGVWVWDATSYKALYSPHQALGRNANGPFDVAFSPDGRLMATVEAKSVKVWDAASGQLSRTLSGPDKLEGSWHVCVTFSPDGKRLAVGTGAWRYLEEPAIIPGVVFVFEVVTGEKVCTLRGLKYSVWRLAFSPDGRRLAGACGDYQTRGGHGEVKVWDLATGKEVFLFKGLSGCAFDVAFSPDGKRLAAGAGLFENRDNKVPGEVRVWDMLSGEEVLALPHPGGCVFGVAYSPDGRRLATCCGDGTVRIWGAAPGPPPLVPPPLAAKK
jgi:WD40 repeat protein